MPRTVRVYDESRVRLLRGCSRRAMQRTSHALVVDGKVVARRPGRLRRGAGPRAPASGEIAGVLQLLDRHNRDCAPLAERFGVPHLKRPGRRPGHAAEGDPGRPLPGLEGDRALVARARGADRRRGRRRQRRLYTGGRGAVGHAPDAARAARRVGLRSYAPRHLLMGHGAGVHGVAAKPALEQAHARARRDIPAVLEKLPTLGR